MKNSIDQYFETALWSSVDDNGNPLDNNYGIDDIDPVEIEKQTSELNEFLDRAENLIGSIPFAYLDVTDLAHDFWLTRNRHGVGFWDGDYPEAIGDALTDLAHEYGEVHAYVGDDKKIYFAKG